MSDFDALISLREEALPYPDRAISGSVASSSTVADDDEDDVLLSHRKARARLHSIPRGKALSCSQGSFPVGDQLLIVSSNVYMLTLVFGHARGTI